jgi:hypothetical protein
MKLEATTNIRAGSGEIFRRVISAFLNKLLNELSLALLQLRGRVACQSEVPYNLPMMLHGKVTVLLVVMIFTYIMH